jgi:hypothetical protein
MKVPGPRDLAGLIGLVERSGEQLVALLPRATGLLGSAERLLHDANALVGRIEVTRADAQALVERTEVTRARADELVTGLEPTARRAVALLEGLEPSLTRLQPTLERLAESTDPREVDAMVALVDQLPLLAAKVETDIIPVLDTLTTVSPDLHDLLDVSRELNLMLAKLPGMGRVMKRVDEQQEIEEGHRPPT